MRSASRGTEATSLSLEEFGEPRLWDVRAGRLLPRFASDASINVSACAFRAEDRTVVAVDRRGILRRWDATTGRLVRTTNLATEFAVRHPSQDLSLDEPPLTPRFSPGGKTLVIGDGKGGLVVWDVASGKALG